MNTKPPLHLQSLSLHLLHLLLLILLHLPSTSPDFYDLNVDCAPHPDIVATDSLGFRFIPYYVRLNRCQGKNMWGEANADICHPTRVTKVKFKAEDRYTPGTLRDITMDNHTECVFACPRNETFCQANQTWNPAMCSCCSRRDDAVCADNSRWSEEFCSCVPDKKIEIEELPVIKLLTQAGGIKVKYIIVIVIAESIILIAVSFVVFRICCSKKSKERSKRIKEEQELVRNDDRDTVSTRST